MRLFTLAGDGLPHPHSFTLLCRPKKPPQGMAFFNRPRLAIGGGWWRHSRPRAILTSQGNKPRMA